MTFNDVLRLEGQNILDCAQRLSSPDHQAAIQKAIKILGASLDQGGKIVVTGLGKSGKVAQKIASTLSSTGSLALYLHPTEGLHGDLGAVTKKDCVLALSYTGNTEELVQLVPAFKSLGIPVVSICGKKGSTLVENSDVWIDASVSHEACPHNLAPTTSTTLALAIGDALAVTLMNERKFDAESFAKNHPGGSLGKKLTMRVSDLMKPAPLLTPNATMEDVVVKLTETRMGAVMIADGGKLLGLIVDGDLKRALKLRDKFFVTKASDVMTKNPIVAKQDMMAIDALNLMENRPHQISVLPVVDALDKPCGVIRIHDLIKIF